jgi:hypothetical protein
LHSRRLQEVDPEYRERLESHLSSTPSAQQPS